MRVELGGVRECWLWILLDFEQIEIELVREVRK
jgi:hypothetical protein